MEQLEWTIVERPMGPRGVDWFWWLGLGTLIAAGTALWFDSFLFAAVILLSGFTFGLMAGKHPREIAYSISEHGIGIGPTLYPWETLESFWVEKRISHPALSVVSRKTTVPNLIIPLHEEDASTIRAACASHIPEKERHIPFTHLLVRGLGF